MILDRLFGKSGGGQRIVTSAQLADYLGGRGTSSAGVVVTEARALQYAAVFACVRVLAESVGQIPCFLYERRGEEKVRAVDHPLYPLLTVAPNEWQTAQEWREWAIASLALRGNAFCHVSRVRGIVQEITPFASGAVTPIQDRSSGALTYRVQRPGGGLETLAQEEVLHLKLLPLDGLMGASPIAYARESIGLAIATEQHGAGLFSRGAAPGGVLTSPKPLTPDVQQRLKDSWAERHEGSGKSGRVAVLEDGLAWQSIGMDSNDAQWLEGRKYQRSEVAGIYRVPAHLIGDLEKATFSNIEHQSLDFVIHSLMPYLVRIESRIQLQLLTPAERLRYFARFQVQSLLRGDMASRSAFYTQQVQNGALSPNEIRLLEEMNPREGGDIYLTPANMLINGQPPAQAAAPPAPGGAPPA